jgi:alginate O-acetyltransferase complex protein AlgI
LTVAVVSNLALLGFFKYYDFGVGSLNWLVGAEWLPVLHITLPLGISFYTFQSMSYAVDVYRGDAKAMRNFTDYACFVAMFPQLVAGPIIRFSEVADQLEKRSHTLAKFARGVAFLALGLGKKVLLANPCGKVADVVFNADGRTLVDAWTGAIAYAFQIYFDFSGYSDMAIGLGLMFGFVFAKNFDSPYRSASITEFWRRWHLSLSTFLRDYLYIPIGGNRIGTVRTYVNLMVVMLLGGLWHGASWNFVIWGGIHGTMLAFERWQGKESPYRHLPRPFRVGITFLIVCLAWVFFRAPTLPAAVAYLQSMVGWDTPATTLLAGIYSQPYYLLTLALAGIVCVACPQTWDWTRRLSWPKAAWIVAVLLLALVMLSTQEFNPFIYFIF